MMRLAVLAGVLLCIGACSPKITGAIQGSATASIGTAGPMATYGNALAPPAFYSFCTRQPRLCSTKGSKSPVNLSAERERQLRRVNVSVNASVREEPDIVTEGAADFWTPATAVGDCEDIAILKKQRLLDLGWPASSLLLTVVRPKYSDEGHTLLTVRTDRGDLVLDNLTDRISHWSDTAYRYYARQSITRQGGWEFIRKAAPAGRAPKA